MTTCDNIKTAVYAGSFDPVTNGHLWIIEQASKIFDRVIIAIGENAEKKYTFSLEDRIEMLNIMTKNITNVEVTHFHNELLVNYTKRVGAQFIVRGIRNYSDYEYEKNMRYINSDLSQDINIVFLIPPRNFAEVSSSLVKGLIGNVGWEEIAKQYLPEIVLNKLRKSVQKTSNRDSCPRVNDDKR
jgi:pantetheine-phosphate adenylyltransferase